MVCSTHRVLMSTWSTVLKRKCSRGWKAWEEVLAPEQGDGGRGRCYDGGGGCGGG